MAAPARLIAARSRLPLVQPWFEPCPAGLHGDHPSCPSPGCCGGHRRVVATRHVLFEEDRMRQGCPQGDPRVRRPYRRLVEGVSVLALAGAVLWAVGFHSAVPAEALGNGLALTPPMGWN